MPDDKKYSEDLETILEKHKSALRCLGLDEENPDTLRKSLKEEFDDTVGIARYFGEMRWKMTTFFASVSFAVTGLSLAELPQLRGVVGVVFGFIIYLVGVLLYYRHSENSRRALNILKTIGGLLGFSALSKLEEARSLPIWKFFLRLRFCLWFLFFCNLGIVVFAVCRHLSIL